MAGKMFQGTMQIPANATMRETEELSMVDDEEGIKHEATRGSVDALRQWKDWEKEPPTQAQFNGGLTLEHDSFGSLSVKDMATVCLASIPTRTTREQLQFTPSVVRLSYVNKVFSVAQDSSSSVFPQKVLLDTWAQPVMLGKSLAESLGLSAKDLDPCPFTIATSLRGIEHPMGLTKAPLRLQFNIGTVAYTHISLRCVVTNATTYDILLGQQALYPIGFGHDSWMEEAWFQQGWSQGDGRKEVLFVIFRSLASTIGSQTAMFGCVGESFAVKNFLLEGNRSTMNSPPPSDVEVPSMLGQLEGHPKDPIPPWNSSKELSQRCGELVARVEQK